MQSKSKVWHAYNLAKSCFCRPSDLFDLTDNTWVAYCFDEAVIEFGSRLENELEKAAQGAKTSEDGERKQRAVMNSWLGDKDNPVVKQFANPVATKKRG